MRSRLLALAAAVAMVLVAVQVRGRFDDRAVERRPRIVCANEVAVACVLLQDDADVQVEPAGVTADRLLAAGDSLELDGWLTPGPWAELVRQGRERENKSAGVEAGRPLAQARLAIAVWPDRLAALRSTCGGQEVGWPCLVAATASPAFKLGLPDARRDALGLVALGSVAQAIAPDDPLANDELLGALDALAGAVPRPLPPFPTVLAGGPSLADAYVIVEAGVDAGDRMTPAYPSPVVTAQVMPAHGRGERGERAAELLRSRRVVDALHAAGWEPPSGTAGLPEVGVLEALRQRWAEVAR